MGTYTTNYNLFMPSIGEQGWGTLVNGNFTTIDVTMKSLSNHIGTLETEMDAVEEKVTKLEENISFDTSGNIIGNVNGYLRFKLSTTNPNNGSTPFIQAGETVQGRTNSYQRLFGIIITNPDATRTINATAGANTYNTTVTLYALNVLTGTSRTLTSFEGSWGSPVTKSVTIKLCEMIYGSAINTLTHNGTAVYLTIP